MKKEITITFKANIDEKDIEAIAHDFDKYGADIISENLCELMDIGAFEIHETESGKKLL